MAKQIRKAEGRRKRSTAKATSKPAARKVAAPAADGLERVRKAYGPKAVERILALYRTGRSVASIDVEVLGKRAPTRTGPAGDQVADGSASWRIFRAAGLDPRHAARQKAAGGMK
jgi:hypothetical protein